MRTRIFWGVLALLALILLIPLSMAFYEQWMVYTKGSLVEVTVTSLPYVLSTKGTMKFEFNGKIYSKSINGNSANYFHVGDKIQMKFLKGHQIFLFSNDNPIGWGSFVLLMILLSGICFIYYALKRDTPSVQAFGKKFS